MKRLLLGLSAVLVLGAAVAWSGPRAPRPEFDFQRQKRNPISRQPFNNAPGDFQFAVVSDRTGGHRAKVFSRAVEQLNLLQPEFVMCVGDLIEGYTTSGRQLTREWREFQGYLARLEMPFFYVPGNHDISNKTQDKLWQEKFGRRYYEFVYRNVLFIALNSEDPPGVNGGKIGAEQQTWLKKTLAANTKVRWTLVFLHKPMWIMPGVQKSGWPEVEKLLAGRRYTVFAGHVHRYQKFVRHGQNYYMLATTGGSSLLRGVEDGEFDHLLWVTMKKDGPVLANILLDGVLPENLQTIPSEEEGWTEYNRRPTHLVRGKVLFDGRPVPGAEVFFRPTGKRGGWRWPMARTRPDGSFTLSTYELNDGAPAGSYTVTVEWRLPRFTLEGKPGPNKLPARYATAKTSPLKATVKSGNNNVVLELEKPPAEED
jgi:hypothetical protein